MNEDEIWELAKKPVTEFVDSIKEMDLNVDKLVKFYLKHTRLEQQQLSGASKICKSQEVVSSAQEVPMDEDTNNDEANNQQLLSPLACAKLEIAIVYAINTCYWMYLVTHGEDPAKNEISKDLERIRLFMNRAREVEQSVRDSCSTAKKARTYEEEEW